MKMILHDSNIIKLPWPRILSLNNINKCNSTIPAIDNQKAVEFIYPRLPL